MYLEVKNILRMLNCLLLLMGERLHQCCDQMKPSVLLHAILHIVEQNVYY